MSGPGESSPEDEKHPLLLPWYAAGTLDAWSVRQIDEHLEGCASCRTELDALMSTAATLRRHEGTNHIEIAALMDIEAAGPTEGDRAPRAAREHLAACETCREDLEALRSARRELGRSPDAATVAAAVPGPSSRGFEGWRWAFYAAAAAAVILLLPALRGLRPAAGPPVAREILAVRLMPPTRGDGNGVVLTGPGPWALEVMLPFGAPTGEYLARIVPRGRTSGAEVSLRLHATTDGRLGLLLPSLPDGREFQLTAASLSETGTSYEYSFTRAVVHPDDGKDSSR